MYIIGQKSYVMDYNFPEGSIVSAENFCRSPDRGGFNPWCFSTNPVEMWEYCDVKECTDDPCMSLMFQFRNS